LGVRFDGERPMITGTLAASDLNLTDLFAPFGQTRTVSGAWSEDVIDLAQVTGSNLDLRLSASTAQIGRLRLDDMAANVLVQPGRIEASIGRAEFNKGTLKGRLSLGVSGDSVEFRSQGTFSDVEVAPFLKAVGEPRWVTGRAQGQFLLEGSGKNPAEVVQNALGRTSITVSNGELVGISLQDALRRVEKRPLQASLNWKSGRTPFKEAAMQIAIKDGRGQVSESHLTASDLTTEVHGYVSLTDRTLDLKAQVTPAASAGSGHAPTAIAFDVNGGWDSIAVTPDARSLIERSGAAKPLFGQERVPTGIPVPEASAH
jgi:AsmA protein